MVDLLEAANFCAIYADEFVFFNPLQPTIWELSRKDFSSPSFLWELAVGISLVLAARPLIDRGMCSFVDNQKFHFCQNCYSKGLDQLIPRGSSSDLYFRFLRDFVEHTKVIYDGSAKGLKSFSIHGDEGRLGHDFAGGITVPATEVKKRLKKGSIVPKDIVQNMGLADNHAFFSTNDLVQTHAIADSYNLDGLISTSPQMDVLRYLFGNLRFSAEKQVDFPLLAARDIASVLEFRDQEWHHLADFREVVRTAASSGDDGLQLLDSELAKVEKLAAGARRTINKRIATQVIGSSVTIAAAVASAGISQIVSLALGSLAGGHLIKNLVPDLIDRVRDAESVQDSKLYYAWKAKSLL
jgi:hypothetical protein